MLTNKDSVFVLLRPVKENQKQIVAWSQINALANGYMFLRTLIRGRNLVMACLWHFFGVVEIYFVHALALILKAMRSFCRVLWEAFPVFFSGHKNEY